jgi:hypothetical protein
MLILELLVLILCERAIAIVGGIPFDALPDSTASKKLIRSTVRFLMSTEKGVEHLCSGVIVADRRILSAAHCFQDADVKKALLDGRITMVFPTQNPTKPYDSIKLDPDAILRPPESQKHVDLAMVKVVLDFPRDMKVPLANSGCINGSPYVIAGFGASRKSKSPRDLENLTLRSVKLKKYDAGGGPFINLERTLDVKSGVSNGMGCYGDSGGPTFCKVDQKRWALAGINVRTFPRTNGSIHTTLTPSQHCDSSVYFRSTSINHNIDLIADWIPPNGRIKEKSNFGPSQAPQ